MFSNKYQFLLLVLVTNQTTAAEVAMHLSRSTFYASCANKFPTSFFKDESQKTIEGIFDYWESTEYRDNRWLAYILATAYRETAGTMQPVREGLCATNQCAINAVTKLFKESNRPTKENYALPVNGKSYYGRGLVQLTHKSNYSRVGQALGWGEELTENPDLALNRERAIAILVEGSVQGMFSRDRKSGGWRKLSTYLNDTTTDWVGARSIINPGSKRAHIPAAHAQLLYSCLMAK